jgi:hypothetical protein
MTRPRVNDKRTDPVTGERQRSPRLELWPLPAAAPCKRSYTHAPVSPWLRTASSSRTSGSVVRLRPVRASEAGVPRPPLEPTELARSWRVVGGHALATCGLKDRLRQRRNRPGPSGASGDQRRRVWSSWPLSGPVHRCCCSHRAGAGSAAGNSAQTWPGTRLRSCSRIRTSLINPVLLLR